MPSALLKRARKFSIAIAVVSSTICSSLKCSRSRANSSSEIDTGTWHISSAYSSTSRSSGENAGLSR